MKAALWAGFVYWAIAFSAGFVLGTLRELLVRPRLGETAAVIIELPIMLAISFVGARWTVRRFGVPDRAADRLIMGALAFGLLMLAETLVGIALFGRTPSQQAESYRNLPNLIGLLGQIAFALFPLVVGSGRRRPLPLV